MRRRNGLFALSCAAEVLLKAASLSSLSAWAISMEFGAVCSVSRVASLFELTHGVLQRVLLVANNAFIVCEHRIDRLNLCLHAFPRWFGCEQCELCADRKMRKKDRSLVINEADMNALQVTISGPKEQTI